LTAQDGILTLIVRAADAVKHIQSPMGEEREVHMTTIAVTDASFEADVINSDKPVVVDFWAEWCGPCKQIGPSLEELAAEMGDEVIIAKVNIDENPNAPSRFGVRGIPTMIMFKGGEAQSTKVGAAAKSAIQSWIKESL